MVVVLLVVLGGGIYLYQNQSGSGIPSNDSTQSQTSVSEGLTLDVIQPKDGDTLSESFVTVSGKTTANASVSVNDSDIKADAQGNFSTKVNLDEGENIINVSSSDDSGNYAEKELTVTVKSQQSE